VSAVTKRPCGEHAKLQLRKRVAEEFRSQLILGAPNNMDEAGLSRLSAQLKAKKLVVKLFLKPKSVDSSLSVSIRFTVDDCNHSCGAPGQ
jgi:hypothetical protein